MCLNLAVCKNMLHSRTKKGVNVGDIVDNLGTIIRCTWNGFVDNDINTINDQTNVDLIHCRGSFGNIVALK